MPKTDNVVSFDHKKYRPVKQPVVEIVPINDFMTIPPVYCQRQTQFRKVTTKKLLKKKWYPTHAAVEIFEYPDGRRVCANGNTRAACWKDFEEEGSFELIPEHVIATIYPVNNDEEAKGLYYTIDSADSVEKNPHKITGVFRSFNMLHKLKSKVFAKGGVAKSLEYCSAGRESGNSKPLNWFSIIEDFKEEIIALDAINPITGQTGHYDVNIICAALMMLKRHGSKNTRLLSGLKQLKNGDKGSQSKAQGTDGITKILEEWQTHKQFERIGTNGDDFPPQQDFLIWCFEKWMSAENCKIYRKPSAGIGKGCRANFYETFWDDEN